MKIIIFSDSHKDFGSMVKVMEREAPVNWLIHAGDVHRDVEDLEVMYPRIPLAYVKGNNDYFIHDVPEDRFFTFEGIKIFLTHGHNYGVKYSLAKLYQKGEAMGADLVIFGHTHVAHCEKIGDVTLFNPGAATRSYGVLEINDGKFEIEIRQI
ncbi:MAG: metallophosphoesterase [Clostridia bacterium]|nr:metallophosphoesterase [Clostridia bacterium]